MTLQNIFHITDLQIVKKFQYTPRKMILHSANSLANGELYS